MVTFDLSLSYIKFKFGIFVCSFCLWLAYCSLEINIGWFVQNMDYDVVDWKRRRKKSKPNIWWFIL